MAKIEELGFTKLVALITIFAMVLSLMGVFSLFSGARAAMVTDFKDTISDSDKTVGANHTIQFTIGNAVDASETITITFQSGFTIPEALDYTDVDVTDDGTDLTLAATATGTTWGISVATTTRVITLTSDTGTMANGSVVVFEIGTHASYGTDGDQQITNPATVGSYTITIGGSFSGTGEARIAILDDVEVSATVGSSLSCVISGVSSGTAVKNTTTTITSTTTSIPFSTLTSGTPAIAAQTFSVTTNADDGFSVTLFQDQNLTSAGASDIDCFDDGVCATTSASYAAWNAPAGTLGQEATYGHFGFTSEDNTLASNCGTDSFTTNKWGGLSGTSSQEVMCHTGPADGTTEDQGQVKIGFQVQINALQEAGEYTNTLTYICTPTY